MIQVNLHLDHVALALHDSACQRFMHVWVKLDVALTTYHHAQQRFMFIQVKTDVA